MMICSSELKIEFHPAGTFGIGKYPINRFELYFEFIFVFEIPVFGDDIFSECLVL